MDGSYRSLGDEQFNALIALAAIAPEAPKSKKRMMIAWCRPDGSEPLYVLKPADWAPYNHIEWRKVGECEIDE